MKERSPKNNWSQALTSTQAETHGQSRGKVPPPICRRNYSSGLGGRPSNLQYLRREHRVRLVVGCVLGKDKDVPKMGVRAPLDHPPNHTERLLRLGPAKPKDQAKTGKEELASERIGIDSLRV